MDFQHGLFYDLILGQFIAMHDLLLDDTTNVASLPEYDDRYTTKVIQIKFGF